MDRELEGLLPKKSKEYVYKIGLGYNNCIRLIHTKEVWKRESVFLHIACDEITQPVFISACLRNVTQGEVVITYYAPNGLTKSVANINYRIQEGYLDVFLVATVEPGTGLNVTCCGIAEPTFSSSIPSDLNEVVM